MRHHYSHRYRARDEKDNRNTNTSVHATDSYRVNRLAESANTLLPLKSHSFSKQYTCACGKHFKTFQKFNAHQSTHSSDRSDAQHLHICNICNKEFPIRSYLYQHQVTHENERKHKCTMCTKAFKRLAGLNQHIRGYHYKIKPHMCTVCKHSYALKGDMRRCRHSTLQNKT